MDNLVVEMKGITKVFGGVAANDRVDFALRERSIHGLLGENGAGKTTLMNVLYGLYRPEEGEIFINGRKAHINSPLEAIGLGIGMVHQHFMLCRPLTVVENVMLGKRSRRGILLDTKETASELSALSEKYHMGVDPYSRVWQLSIGEQQRVEILTQLYMGCDILILDEPTAVLTPQETEEFFRTLRRMRDDGKSIILITHKLEEIISIVDEVTVLRDGKMIGHRVVGGDVSTSDLSWMMVGRDVLFDFPEPDTQPGEVKLSLKGIFAKNDKGVDALSDFSLDIRRGEVVGLAGVDGNGQKELCEVLTGMRRVTSGSIQLDGKDITNREPAFYIGQKISHIPEDRHSTGLAINWSLEKNLIVKRLEDRSLKRGPIISTRKIRENWERARSSYQIKANGGSDRARALSGGNQQKVILARELESEPEVLIANQPTRGLDVGASEYVRSKILQARKKGTAVLVVSADLEEILQVSDRIAVIYDGRLMGILPRGASTMDIGTLMMGGKLEKGGER
ncbi:MAG: ABC transporter ATP-binding protein [Spirochaetales bacterium]|nr:ABC transporter ATP-binding protein [Spirochaetales bacterium]